MTFIPYGRQNISDNDIQAVKNVLMSDYLTQGPAVPAFEEALSSYCNVKYGVAVNSATSALHIACLALDLAPGDYAWTVPNSFVASANAILYCGATVDFVDIEKNGANMCPVALEAKLVNAKANGILPKIVIPVHMGGHSANMEKIYDLSKQYGFRIIEDASHAIGARYFGTKVGACEYSDVTVFSFHPVKIITTAEGGLATTNNEQLASRMRKLRSHGITRDESEFTEDSHGPWYYQQQMLGFNYRMTDIQAALGLSQLERLDEFVENRNRLAERYDQLLSNPALLKLSRTEGVYSSYHLYIVLIDHEIANCSKTSLFETMHASNIGVNLHYIPIHLQPYYQNLGFAKGDFPEAESYYDKALSIPLHAKLSISDQDKVIEKLSSCLG